MAKPIKYPAKLRRKLDGMAEARERQAELRRAEERRREQREAAREAGGEREQAGLSYSLALAVAAIGMSRRFR